MTMTRQNLRRRTRESRVILGADIPPYEPQTGDIVTAYFRFSEETVSGGLPDKENPDKDGRMQPDPKFRTCLVLKPKEKNKPPVLVPISSKRERYGRHVPITDPAEQDACDLREGQDAYAKILEARKYHLPSPLMVPSEVAREDGTTEAAWVIGRAPKALLLRVQAAMTEQARAGNITGFFEERAGEVPEHTLELMRGQVALSRQHYDSVRARAAERARPAPVPESASRQPDDPRAAKAQEAAEKLARARGAHPDQTAPARANALALAERRGTTPEQVAARRAAAAQRPAEQGG